MLSINSCVDKCIAICNQFQVDHFIDFERRATLSPSRIDSRGLRRRIARQAPTSPLVKSIDWPQEDSTIPTTLHGSSSEVCSVMCETRPLVINARMDAYLVEALDKDGPRAARSAYVRSSVICYEEFSENDRMLEPESPT